MALLKKFKKVKSKGKKLINNVCFEYINYVQLPIDNYSVLLEAGQGSNVNGNMFALLKELKTNKKWSKYNAYFVVTQDSYESAKDRMDFYKFDNVKLVVRLSKEYNKVLATAKYIMTDNSFPPYFNKRDEQVFLNTWHGTPLKTLGASDKSSYNSPANIQKNYLQSDFALFPNEFTKNVFMDDYHLRHIFNHQILISNYPRNYVFYDKEQGKNLKSKLNLDGYKIYAYMPTWRGGSRIAQVEEQINITNEYLQDIDNKLNDDQLFYVNLHFLVSNSIDYTQFKHIRKFPSEYETYEFLNICDCLVTDYSSVFFDFAITGKQIVLFAYDKEDYLKNRGTYMPFDELPFEITENVDDLIYQFNNPTIKDRTEFLNTYCKYGDKNICEDVLELVINGNKSNLNLYNNKDYSSNCDLIFNGKLNGRTKKLINNYVENTDSDYQIMAFRGNLNKTKTNFINNLPETVIPLGLVTAYQFTKSELLHVAFSHFFKSYFNKKDFLNNFFKREKNRLFSTINPVKITNYNINNRYISNILQQFSCPIDNHFVPAINDYYCKNIFPKFYKNKDGIGLVSFAKIKSIEPFALCDTSIDIGKYQYKPVILLGNSNKKKKTHFVIYKLFVPVNDTNFMAQNNKVVFNFNLSNEVENTVLRRIYFNAIYGRRSVASRSRIKINEENKIAICFRQAAKNRMNLYVREQKITDPPIEQIKLILAFIVSKLFIKNNIIYMFEKEGSRFEESASILYKHLIDNGYDNAYFLITKDYSHLNEIEEKYKKNFLYKGTFKQYVYFFKSKTFIGSEAMAHAIDITVMNRLALSKVMTRNKSYVFLQHGVMYMVSLDSPSRTFFKRKNLNGKYRVVVSSQAESDHFTQIGNHREEDMYICGLPKFDNNIKYDNADKIVIMPTWRPWEANEFQTDFENSKYYKMIMRICDGIPAEYRDKIIILPHPLLAKKLEHSQNKLKDKMLVDEKYDDILKDTALLITDYSSIAYDAYYRGAQVIFYWEEKDECMQEYGDGTKLMLNDDNVFAPVAYNQQELTKAFNEVYMKEHSPQMQEKYNQIVQFHDGKNTDRLIQMLKDDELI